MKVHIREDFKTREAAEKFVQTYMKAYTTQGYGTDIRVFPIEQKYASTTGNKWAVIGHRSATAD